MDINIFKHLGMVGGDDNGGYYFRDAVSTDDGAVVIVSAPWAVTSADGEGASYAPDAIIDASTTIGLYDAVTGVSIEGRVATAEIDYDIQESSQQLGADAGKVLSHIEDGGSVSGDFFGRKLARINTGFRHMHASVARDVARYASQGKIVGVVGGDHSVSFGAIRAISECCEGVGVLFLDAHCDMGGDSRIFDYSHRSIARNILEEIPAVSHVTMVGVRDCVERDVLELRKCDRASLFLAESIAAARFGGRTWRECCADVIATLPQTVYVSMDVDVLAPDCCPNTVRPVPGGLSFDEVAFLLGEIAASDRRIVGFDVTEVVPKLQSGADALVGARMLAKLCAASLKSAQNR